MLFRRSATTVALAAALCAACAVAFAADDSKYPEWRGQWRRPPGVGIQWDPTKPLGPAQQAPLTPEYQKVFEASMADQRAGGQGGDPTYTCIPPGMPRAMTVVFPMEIIILPDTTYIMHRIFQSGAPHLHRRARLAEGHRARVPRATPSANGSTRTATASYDVLEVETRGFKGPRAYDAERPAAARRQRDRRQGAHLSRQGQSRTSCIDEITTIDNALTRPWTVTKKYGREKKQRDLVRVQSARRTTATSRSARTTTMSAPTAS